MTPPAIPPSYSTVTATYNNAGRLRTLANSSTTETSVYNAPGQRIRISGGVNSTVLYVDDEAGHLLGEYDGTGTLIEEAVWLGDIPVATLRPNGVAVAIYYIHSDPLNTPRQVTRPSDDTPMWTWNSDPFGTDAANPNPSGAGTFAYNLRFAGQVFDGQAGLQPTVENESGTSVAQLEAATIALRQFKLDQPRADAQNVFASASESRQEFKVAFLPRQNPSEVGHEGSTDYITMDNPKGNQFGRYVEYRISKTTKKIVGSTYAR